MKKLQSELLDKLQRHKLGDGVLVFATTNRAWAIDPTFFRRFPTKVKKN